MCYEWIKARDNSTLRSLISGVYRAEKAMSHLEDPTSREYSQSDAQILTAIFDMRAKRINLKIPRPYKRVVNMDIPVLKKVLTQDQLEELSTSTPGPSSSTAGTST